MTKQQNFAVGSVVTKDVPEFTIVAGNPAKVIKYVNDKTERGYMQFNTTAYNILKRFLPIKLKKD